MAGIDTGPGAGKDPRDRNEFPLGPFRYDVDRELPQVRQKAERVQPTAAAIKPGSQILRATVTSYNSVSRQGSATVENGAGVTFINATKLATTAGDIILVTELLNSTSFAMIGLLTQSFSPGGAVFPGATLTLNFPIDMSSTAYVVSNFPSYDISGQLGYGTDFVVGRGGTNLAGFSIDSTTQITFGVPPNADFTSTATARGPRIMPVGSKVVVKHLSTWTDIYDPATGWSTATGSVTPSNNVGSFFGDRSSQNLWWSNILSSTTNFEYYDGTSIVNAGTLGLPASTSKVNRFPFISTKDSSTFSLTQESNNGWMVVTIGSNHYAKPINDTSNFTQLGYSGSIPTGIDCFDPNGRYLYTLTVLGDFYVTDFVTGSQALAASGIFPTATFAPRTMQISATGGFLVAGTEEVLTLPSPPGGSIAGDKCFAIYGISLTPSPTYTLYYYDYNTIYNGTAFEVMSGFDRVNGNLRILYDAIGAPGYLYEFVGV